jgi:hypothetical protein
VSVLSPAWRTRGNRAWLGLATAIGAFIGVLLGLAPRVARGGLTLAGPLLLVYGLYLAWHPLGFIAGGLFLLWADRNIR